VSEIRAVATLMNTVLLTVMKVVTRENASRVSATAVAHVRCCCQMLSVGVATVVPNIGVGTMIMVASPVRGAGFNATMVLVTSVPERKR